MEYIVALNCYPGFVFKAKDEKMLWDEDHNGNGKIYTNNDGYFNLFVFASLPGRDVVAVYRDIGNSQFRVVAVFTVTRNLRIYRSKYSGYGPFHKNPVNNENNKLINFIKLQYSYKPTPV